MSASKNRRTDVVELLIKHNADVNGKKEVRLHTLCFWCETTGTLQHCTTTDICLFLIL